jgi:hypothetical protein
MSEPNATLPADDPLAELQHRLRRLYRERGEPSLRNMEKLAGKVLSHTTIGKVLKCVAVPVWDQLAVVVEVLNGDPVQFKVLWIAARDAADTKQINVELPLVEKLQRENAALLQEREALAAVLATPGGADPPAADRDSADSHRHTLRQLSAHARLILVQGKIELARVLMEHALNGYRRMPGATPDELHQAMAELAAVMLRARKTGPAAALSRQVYIYRQRTLGPAADETVIAGYALAEALHETGSHGEADRLRNQLKLVKPPPPRDPWLPPF